MAIEIVDFPKKIVIFHCYVNVHQRVEIQQTMGAPGISKFRIC